MIFAAKAEINDPSAATFELLAAKTMYGGKSISVGDTIYIFASENEGGAGLVARGVVIGAQAVPKANGAKRQTPRVNVRIKSTARAKHALGREALKTFKDWNDGKPQTELNFKFYRQATNKIAGVSDRVGEFLSSFF